MIETGGEAVLDTEYQGAVAASGELAPIDLVIVICTFRREKLLSLVLDSIRAQTVPPGTRISVVVSDNSDEGSAAAVVAAEAAKSPFEIRYVEAHPPNISVARNAGIRASDAPFVAFVDDDEELAPGWLEAVVNGLRTYPHDVLFGHVDTVFETTERVTPAIRQLFSRFMQAPSGQEVVAIGAPKGRGLTVGTSNSILRRATTLTDATPFDPDFGNVGGEDLDFYCRLQMRGRRFAWLPEARASEFVPASRCDPAYLRRRFYAGGQAYAEAVARNSAAPVAVRWWLRAKALVQLCLLALRYPSARRQGGAVLTDFGFRWAGVRGKLSLAQLYPVYREADGARRPAS